MEFLQLGDDKALSAVPFRVRLLIRFVEF